MNLRLCLLWATLIVPAAGFPQITQELLQTKDHNPPTQLGRAEIPFKLYQNYLIVVQGSLGTIKRLNFLIDTGANPSTVDRRIAKKLGLKGVGAKLALFNQNTNVDRVLLPSLQLGPIRAESLPGLVQDLSPVEKVLGVRIDAIIGFGVLSLSSFSIDYRSKRMTFGPIEPPPLAVPFDTGPPSLTLQLRVENEPVRLLVDTGAADMLLFECRLPSRLRRLPARALGRSSNSLETVFEMKEVWLPGVHLGVTDFGLEKAFLVNDPTNCGRSFDGVVGATSLGLKWIAFDFEHRSFSWMR